MAACRDFYPGILIFNLYSQEKKKKAYLIGFSFKFKEIKFCTLLWIGKFGKNAHPFL